MPIYNRLTDRQQASGVTLNDIIHVVITSDQTQSPQGSSFYAPLSFLQPILSGASGTSGTSGSSGISGLNGIDGSNSRRWGGLNTALAPNIGGITFRNVGGTVTLDPSLIANIRANEIDSGGSDMTNWFNALDSYTSTNVGKAYVQITDSFDQTIFGIYEVGNVGYNVAGYWQIGTTLISSSAPTYNFSSTTLVTLSWVLFGADGTSGVNGTSGLSGTSGSNGTSGTSGSNGTSGSSGTNGSSGTSGTSGTSGSNGVNGSSGTSGTSGSSGTSGTSGTDGSSGTSGTNGSSGTSGVSVGGALGYWGSFWSTQDQQVGSTLSAYTITYNNTDPDSNGVSIVSNSQITFANAGVYNIQFSAQVDRTSGSGTDTVDIWFRKNGIDIPESNTTVTVAGGASAAKTVAAWNYMLELAANDYIELAWRSSDLNLELIHEAAATSPTRPAIPSVIATAQQVLNLQQGTSGTSGTSGTNGSNGVNGTSGTSGTSGSSISVPGANNEILTSNGSGGMVAESNATFNGTTLTLTKDSSLSNILIIDSGSTANDPYIRFQPTATTRTYAIGIDKSDGDTLKITYGTNSSPSVGNVRFEIFSGGTVSIPQNNNNGVLLIGTSDQIRFSPTLTSSSMRLFNGSFVDKYIELVQFDGFATFDSNIGNSSSSVPTYILNSSLSGFTSFGSQAGSPEMTLYNSGSTSLPQFNSSGLYIDNNLNVAGGIRLGTPSGTGVAVYRNGSTGILSVTSSDQRLKTNITTITGATDIISGLRGVYFNWLEDDNFKPDDDSTQIGLIAQEVESVFPEAVTLNGVEDYKTVRYSEMVALLIEGIKEQNQVINNLQIEVNQLRERLDNL